MDTIKYKKTNGEDPDFVRLCGELDNCLEEMVGKVIQRSKYEQYNKLDRIHDVFIAYDKEAAVGCGSYKAYSEDTAELKRVFLQEKYRGKGIAKEMLGLLEEDAKKAGYQAMILETGILLKGSTGLYQHTGYKVIPNYGQYENMPESLCMKKCL